MIVGVVVLMFWLVVFVIELMVWNVLLMMLLIVDVIRYSVRISVMF